MKKHISFPSIEQFRNIVANINREHNFVGLDENGEAIYDTSRPKPVLTFKGTVKLHGTNASVCYNKENGFWVQSRENIITPERDNAGFAFFANTKIGTFMGLMNVIHLKENITTSDNTVTIYGEWVGKGIQKGIAISNLEKSFFIFGVKITPHPKNEEDKPVSYWVDYSYLKSPENRIYNIDDYKTYSIDIDFGNPQLSQNTIIDMTIEVENECPVGKAFGYEGIGEGIVFSHMTKNGRYYRFKSKGEKHSESKVKTLKPVDNEKINKIIDVVNRVTPAWRLEQAMEKTFDLMNGGSIDIKKMGDFIRNVVADIHKEELDVIAEAGLEPKEINSKVSEICRGYFFAEMNKEVGLN